MVTGKSIATLVVFIISIIFVIQPVHVPVRLPHLGRRKIPVTLTTAPIVAIAILWASQCIDPAVIRSGIVGTQGVKPYNILILFFSLAYMAITLDVTGILQSAAYWVSNRGGADGWKLFFYFYVMLTLVSVVIGNDPVILSGTAFLVYYTRVVEELQPLPWLISEFAAANTASMVLFVGNPTNVVICEGFAVNNAAFTAYTIVPFLACNVACFIALAVQYRSPKHLPRKITPTQLDVRSVLLDPRSALIGSIWLGTCLAVCIVVSFFNVDVWMISLPFAVTKFIYDLAWDHYRYENNRPMLGRGQSDPEEKIPEESPRPFSDDSRSSTQEPAPNNKTKDIQQYPIPEHEPSTSPLPSTSPFPPTSPFPTPSFQTRVKARFPTFFKALPRLPFALVPFAFSQFILIEALAHQGWIDVFATWLVRATKLQIYPTIWVIGVLGVLLCNLSGTNIGATILLTKVVRAADMPVHSLRAAAIALAVASNIGAVSFTFSASLAGLLWKSILDQKKIQVKQWEFAKWNVLPLAAMTAVGLSAVSVEMAVLYGGKAS
ncbi:hypothetical protein JB92DRAFT_2810381 [Gautieria morchelliformis]|nr:hypothetical protein JB92DRAFT_2810381 [Gautieria morchelliformis]